MMFANTPREWKRVSISMTISVEAPYWDAMRLPVSDVSSRWRKPQHLPTGLLTVVEKTLMRLSPFGQDSHLSFYLGRDSRFGDVKGPCELPVQIKKTSRSEAYLRMSTDMLRHMNVPWFLEEDLDTRPLSPANPSLNFISFLKPRWFLDARIGSLPAQISSASYEL